jgi:hypothetical protein
MWDVFSASLSIFGIKALQLMMQLRAAGPSDQQWSAEVIQGGRRDGLQLHCW